MFRTIVKFIFFGNYFYGACAVALAVEASLQQNIPLNAASFYVFIFALTALYYTRAYITEKMTCAGNSRSDWYWQNRKLVILSQLLLTCIVLLYAGKVFYDHNHFIVRMPISHWLLLLIFPVVAGLYYGVNHPVFRNFKLRNVGWLKPFIIGFVWAGLANVYPVIIHNIENEVVLLPDMFALVLFIKNFMFVSVLCIMFDIKDYAADHNLQLKTFVVKAGLRKTIFMILIPLSVLGLSAFLLFAYVRQFGVARVLPNVIPFILLIMVAYSLHKRKSILYYLVVIDGLMLVKAFCGISAMLLTES